MERRRTTEHTLSLSLLGSDLFSYPTQVRASTWRLQPQVPSEECLLFTSLHFATLRMIPTFGGEVPHYRNKLQVHGVAFPAAERSLNAIFS